jgi:hypothetical protein
MPDNTKPEKKERTFQEIDGEIDRLKTEKSLLFNDFVSSNDIDKIIKAEKYVKDKTGVGGGNKTPGLIKGYLFSPEREFYTGLGYKSSLKSITYDLLRKMGHVPIIHSVISTRIEQIENFMNFSNDFEREGWTIRKKLSRFDSYKKDYNLTDVDKKIIEKIAKFLEDGGTYNKWEMTDDLDIFIKKLVKDSLELDQACFEIERNRRGDLLGFTCMDGGTMRLLESIDDKSVERLKFDKQNGFPPIYAQVHNQQILKNHITKEPVVYYPWELCFMTRNKSTYIRRNGYGKSELEILMEIITWLLWGMQYNGNFFKQGSNPKGFFTIDGGVDQDMLNEFRSAWRQTVSGVMNSHKIPVFEGDKINWVDMQHSNKDMEFQLWNEFLTLITCSVFKIDPSELGYNFRQQSQLFGQQGQKERLEHSKNKGLKPILKSVQKEVNKYIVSEMNDRFEFIWTGVSLEDESEMLENDVKKANAGFVSQEDMFEKYSHREFDSEKDTILNTVYQQAQQAKMFGGAESNEAVDQMTGEEGDWNPFDEYEKAMKDNPIAAASIDYINKSMFDHSNSK